MLPQWYKLLKLLLLLFIDFYAEKVIATVLFLQFGSGGPFGLVAFGDVDHCVVHFGGMKGRGGERGVNVGGVGDEGC